MEEFLNGWNFYGFFFQYGEFHIHIFYTYMIIQSKFFQSASVKII